MRHRLQIGACVLIASGAPAAPASAGAAGIQTAVSHVRVHTDRADAALDRAVSLFAKGRDSQARVAYAKSRKEMGRARAAAARARRGADTASEYRLAATAQRLLGREQGENVDELARALRPAEGDDERRIASAARADTRGREKAIAVLTELLALVPEQARTGIARAIASLSQDRDGETAVQARALTSSRVSTTSKRRVLSAIRSSVQGQARAAETLAALIASTEMPAESKPGLKRAYDNVIREHGSVADILSRLSDRMPAFAREHVERIVTQARTDAQGMRESHPTGPPAGVPGGAPGGVPPAGAPGGPPSGLPGGPPSSIPGPPIG